MMDSLCGNSGEGGDYQASPEYLKTFAEAVVAAVAYGDPSHTAGAPWNLGSSKTTASSPAKT